MNSGDEDPLDLWRRNPFFVLGIGVEASRTEIERAGQRLLGLIAVGSAAALHYETPLGAARRDEETVRAAVARLRDPDERVACELLARIAPLAEIPKHEGLADAWAGAERAFGWKGPWVR